MQRPGRFWETHLSLHNNASLPLCLPVAAAHANKIAGSSSSSVSLPAGRAAPQNGKLGSVA